MITTWLLRTYLILAIVALAAMGAWAQHVGHVPIFCVYASALITGIALTGFVVGVVLHALRAHRHGQVLIVHMLPTVICSMLAPAAGAAVMGWI